MGELWNKVYDKLGVGGYNTPVGMTVMTATTPGLPPEGDSARVMAVVDAVNASKYSGGVNQLQKALAKQEFHLLAQKRSFPALGKYEFLKNVEIPVTGSLGFTVRDQALCLIKEWGLTFADSPTLYYTPLYKKEKDKGVKFPLDESEAAANLIRTAEQCQPCSKKKSNKSVMFVATEKELAKVDGDLDTVENWITLCNEMLEKFPSGDGDEMQRLSKVVGILEACMPRIADLIDAGMRKGAITPELLERCLHINDKLLRVLDAERKADIIQNEALKPEQKEEEELTNMDGDDEMKHRTLEKITSSIEQQKKLSNILDLLGGSNHASSEH